MLELRGPRAVRGEGQAAGRPGGPTSGASQPERPCPHDRGGSRREWGLNSAGGFQSTVGGASAGNHDLQAAP